MQRLVAFSLLLLVLSSAPSSLADPPRATVVAPPRDVGGAVDSRNRASLETALALRGTGIVVTTVIGALAVAAAIAVPFQRLQRERDARAETAVGLAGGSVVLGAGLPMWIVGAVWSRNLRRSLERNEPSSAREDLLQGTF